MPFRKTSEMKPEQGFDWLSGAPGRQEQEKDMFQVKVKTSSEIQVEKQPLVHRGCLVIW